MNRPLALALILVASLGMQRSGLAEETENKTTPWKRAGLNLGVFFATTNSNVAVGVEGFGLDVDVEKALGLDTITPAGRIDGFWRFTKNKRQRVDFRWFALRRSGSTMLGRDITIDSRTFPLGTRVKTNFDFDIYKGAYSYSFLQDDRFDLAASVELYVAPISFDITAT